MSERLFDEAFLQRLERMSLIARKATLGQTQGERRSPRRGQSVEFADFRPYVAGDDFRRIDWNAYARLERFFIKLFIEEEDLTVHFLIDASGSMAWGQPSKLNYAIRAAGALGYIALAGLDRVTATAIGKVSNSVSAYFPPHRGKNQALAYFNYLSGVMGKDSTRNLDELTQGNQDRLLQPVRTQADPARALQTYAANARPGPLLLLSDLMNDGWVEGLRALASRGFEVTVVHILAPEEAEPDLDGDFKLLDVEDGTPVEISADYELLTRYKQGLANWQEELRGFCTARQMAYVPLVTTVPLDELLFAWLQKKGVLR